VWMDDCVQILLDSRHDRRQVNVMAVDAAGTLADYTMAGRQKDLGWDIPCRIAASSDRDGWTVEAAIPRSALDDPLNDVIGFNIVRRRHGADGDPLSWNPGPVEYESARALGKLVFETRPCSIQKVEVGWPHVGRNRFRIWLRNASDMDQSLRVGVVTRRPNGAADRSRYQLSVPAGQVVAYALTHFIRRDGPCELGLMLTDDQGKRPIASFTRPGLRIEASALVFAGGCEVTEDRMIHQRFRILLPRRELDSVTLGALLRGPDGFPTYCKMSVMQPPSRTGVIAIETTGLPAGTYRLDAHVQHRQDVLGRDQATVTLD